MEQATLNDITGKIAEGLKVLGGFRVEAENQIRMIVEGALEHFDVVTHERMQVQEALLRKAQEDMRGLEERIHELEKRLKARE